MRLEAIHHSPKSSYSYAYTPEWLHVKLRAAKNDLAKVTLVYGDKYRWVESQSAMMEKTHTDEFYDYFTAQIRSASKRIAYYFILEDGHTTLCFTESGFSDRFDREEYYYHLFQYPFMSEADIHVVPDWAKGAVFYQIFPERFDNGDPANDPEGCVPWDSDPGEDRFFGNKESFFGGDLQGVIRRLDFLSALGINAIYLTPIFQAETYHKYDTVDFKKVDPHFGDLELLKKMVRECHERGIRVVLDAVFSLCSFYSVYFQDVVEKGPQSPYYDWFYVNEWPIGTEPPTYRAWADYWLMPKLNTSNPDVQRFLIEIGQYWIREADIDGWRLDTADEVSHDFWRQFRKAVQACKPDVFLLGEIWHDPSPWLRGDQFDSVMNYPLQKLCIEFFARGTIDGRQFRNGITVLQTRHTRQVNEAMFNLLDSHDTVRFLDLCGGDERKLKLAVAFMLTYPGAPCIYYGSEVGMTGGSVSNGQRRGMVWNERDWNWDLLNFYRAMIGLRNRSSALSKGTFRWVDNPDGRLLAWARESHEETVYVLLNMLDTEAAIQMDIQSESWTDGWNGKANPAQEGVLNAVIPPVSARIAIVQNNRNLNE